MRALLLVVISLPAFAAPEVHLPKTSWTPEKQAVHLLDRLAYGPSPTDLAEVERIGPELWIKEQLEPASIPDRAVDAKLAPFHTLNASTAELERDYPPLMQVAKKLGLEGDRDEMRAELRGVIDPMHVPAYIGAELMGAKLVRAIESRRQLQEVLADFWFNHFNVSFEKGPVKWMLTSYERDAIRPHLFGTFRELLGAVAHHPAMLFYLDNWLSTREGFEPPLRRFLFARADKAPKAPNGINENYARELLELHTVGVDGGYSQQDIREIARAFTGWTIDRPRIAGEALFRPRPHDAGEKHLLGLTIPSGGGEDDGERVLDYLAELPQTAHFVAKKLCQKFVADDPPPQLVDRVANVFLATHGDLKKVYVAIFESPEFWSERAFEAKTKTPLEYAASAVRALGGTTSGDPALSRQIEKMGEPLYRCQPPTGFPEVATPWVNAGALLARINFGLALAHDRVQGIDLHLDRFVPVDGSPAQTVDALAGQILHRPISAKTRTTLLDALDPAADIAPLDGERPKTDVAQIAGLLLGSPEFQKQ
jgi:uncharacterized protein (DUF1800 family)